MNRKKKNKKIITISVLLLLISIGFAYLTATLEMDALAGVRGNTWKIYFDNVEVYKGESLATIPPATTGTDTTDLEYSVTLTAPGDIYKFYVDIVNAGSLNAMVNVVKKTDLTEEEKKFLNYTVTYADETPIEQLDLLTKQVGDTPTRDTIVVTIEYKKDVAEEYLPESDITVTETLHLDYRQANTSATARTTSSPKITYNWNFNFVKNGDFTDGLEHWDSMEHATIEIDKNITYNGKPSMHILTTTTNYSGIANDYQDFTINEYPYGHSYLFHGCFYKDSTSAGGGVNQPIRMYIGYIDSSGSAKYSGLATRDFTKIQNSLIEKQWVCLDDIVNIPENNIDNKTNKSLRLDNHNLKLINNYWVADLALNIVEEREYSYNTSITELPTPERDGYTFDGWYTDPYGGTKVEVGLNIRESATYYAHWS